jgi:hypothetical protein
MTQPSRRHFLKTSVVGAATLSGTQTFAQSPNPSPNGIASQQLIGMMVCRNLVRLKTRLPKVSSEVWRWGVAARR